LAGVGAVGIRGDAFYRRNHCAMEVNMTAKIGPKEQRQRELREAAAARITKAGGTVRTKAKAKIVGKVQSIKISRRGE
jgi:hypothetical protein